MPEPFIHGLRNVRIEFSGKAQVTLGPLQSCMSQVDREVRKGNGEVNASLYPAFQTVNGERMTKIVYAWSLAPASVRNTGLPEKAAKVRIDDSFGVSSALGRREEDVLRLSDRMYLLSVVAAPLDERGMQGNEPVFVELGVSDGECPLFRVHVSRGQVKCFRYPKAASVEHSIKQRKDPMTMRVSP
jgi:hypothetical protein